jgi:hypothetical protein
LILNKIFFIFDFKTNKRARYEQSNNIELENQPPRATIKRGSLFLYHQDQQGNNLQIENDIPSSVNQLSTYHRMYSAPNHQYEQNLLNPCDLHTEYLTNQHLYMFGNDTLMTSAQKSKQRNEKRLFLLYH